MCNGYHTKGSGEASRIARAQADSETTVQSNLKVKKRAPHVVARACHFRLQWARRAPYGFNVTSEDGKPLVSSSRPIMFARTSQPSAAVRSLLSWRGWRSASAIFCSARSRHSAAVSMAFLGGPRRGAFKQKAPNASVQNRTPQKKKPRRSGAIIRLRCVSGSGLAPPTRRVIGRLTNLGFIS